MRLLQPPTRTLPKAPEMGGGGREWPGENCTGGAQACLSNSHLQLQSWCQGQPWRSPCNKPLHLPSSKDSFPKLPACLPARPPALSSVRPSIHPPTHPPWSCLSVPSSVCLLFALGSFFLLALGGRSPFPKCGGWCDSPPPKMGKGVATRGHLVSCTEVKCSLHRWYYHVCGQRAARDHFLSPSSESCSIPDGLRRRLFLRCCAVWV